MDIPTREQVRAAFKDLKTVDVSGDGLEVLYTPKQVQAALQVSYATLYRWIQIGRIKALRLGGDGPYRFRAKDVRDVMVDWEARPESLGFDYSPWRISKNVGTGRSREVLEAEERARRLSQSKNNWRGWESDGSPS